MKKRIAVGPVLDQFGGVSQHIFAIKRYSVMNPSIIAPAIVRRILRRDPSPYGTWLYTFLVRRIGLGLYDVTHSHSGSWFIKACFQARRRAKLAMWIHTYHTLYFAEDYPDGLPPVLSEMNWHQLHVASRADVKIAGSPWIARHLWDRHHVKVDHVIPNAFDSDACDTAVPARFTGKYGISNFVLFAGTAGQIKNPQTFVELARHLPDRTFVMIGRNTTASFLKTNYNVPIPKNLLLLGEIPRGEVFDAIAASRVFVMTSKREGFPTALLEAMGQGVPVVAPDHTGCKDAIGDARFGFLYEPNSLPDLVSKVNQAWDAPDIGARGSTRARELFDWKVTIKQLDKIYLEGALKG